ncbi:pentapeptide repeat-containing protein [Saccharothrix longispora]
MRPMPARVVALVAAGIAAATAGVVVALWWAGTAGLSGQSLVTARLDALRTGLSIGIGGGGIFALYLAWRRQHATEIGLVQAEQVARDTREDAAARRVTELYAKSAEQLGSDKAPVRLAGLYALERLAQDNPHQRATVVNVLCAYLRMPFTQPDDSATEDVDEQTRARHDDLRQERQVRLTAQRILTAHLRPGPRPEHPLDTFWPDTDLDLTGAILVDLDFMDCRPREVEFGGAVFIGNARFLNTTFTADVWFWHATFAGDARFAGATFAKDAWFDEVMFHGETDFLRATFGGLGSFDGAMFAGDTLFSKVGSTGQTSIENCFVTHPVPEDSSWPATWRPADEHGPVEGFDGTWHRLVEVEAELVVVPVRGAPGGPPPRPGARFGGPGAPLPPGARVPGSAESSDTSRAPSLRRGGA